MNAQSVSTNVADIDGGHFNLTFYRARTQNTAVVEQNM